MAVKVIILALFSVVTIFVGYYYRKWSQNVDDFLLGGRKVGLWISAFSYGATYQSAVVFVGFAGQFGWRLGASVLWVPIAVALCGSYMPWMILGRRTRLMTQHIKSATMPEFFSARYMSTGLKLMAAFIIFIFMIPYTASLYNGLSRLFAMAFNIDFVYCIAAMAIITAIFVIWGGYFATVANDFIQGCIMLVGIVAVNIVALNFKGGLTEALLSLARVTADEGATAPGIFTSFFGPDPVTVLGIVVLTTFGTWGLPQMVAKFYSIKSEKKIAAGAVVSTAFAVVVAGGCYFLGMFGRLYADVVQRRPDGSVIYDSIVPTMLSSFPDLMIAIVITMVFAASISTLSSLVLVSSSTFTLDFLKGHVIKKMDDKKQVLIIQSLIIVFIIASSLIAIYQYRGGLAFIAQFMSISWGGMAGSFFAPLLYGLYWKRVSKASVWCCFIFSTCLMFAHFLFGQSFPGILKSSINTGALALLAGCVIVPVVSLLTKAPDKAVVENCFSCLKDNDR